MDYSEWKKHRDILDKLNNMTLNSAAVEVTEILKFIMDELKLRDVPKKINSIDIAKDHIICGCPEYGDCS